MRAPQGLTEKGKAAFARAAARVVEVVGEDRAGTYVEAIARYARAVDLADRLHGEWVAAGRPTVERFPNGAVSGHPLIKLMADANRGAARAEAAVHLDLPSATRRSAGGQKGSHRAPDRLAEPPRLTRVADVGAGRVTRASR